MKLEFLVENIERLLPIISKILPLHAQVPVLSNLLLEATEKGFFIYSTNLETGVKIKIPAKIEEMGSTSIPGKQFVEAIGSLPKDKATISLEKDRLTLICRGNSIVFNTISKDEFPSLFEEKGEKIETFSEEEIRSVFPRLTFAASLDESRPELTGILLSQKKDHIDLVATDGFRLSLKKINNDKMLNEQEEIILPSRLVIDALSLQADKGITMYVNRKANQVLFETEEAVLVGRIIRGEFPNYERVIPSSSKTKISLDQEEFLQKTRLSSIFARDAANIVNIKVEGGKVRLSARAAGVGEGEAVLEGKQEGEDNGIAFNVKFLLDLLKNASGKNITMELSSAVEPALFKTEDDPGFLHIIMPVRVQE